MNARARLDAAHAELGEADRNYARLLARPEVIANRAYFNQLAEQAWAVVGADPYDTEAQADAVLDQCPPPAGVHLALAGAFVRFEIVRYVRKLVDLAEMAGCSGYEPMLLWMLAQGLIRVRDDGGVELVTPS